MNKRIHTDMMVVQATMDHLIQQCRAWPTSCNMQAASQPHQTTKKENGHAR